MRPCIIIDGYNLVYTFPRLRVFMSRNRSSAARRALLAILLRVYRRDNQEILIYFDGVSSRRPERRSESVGNIHVVYTGQKSADFLIQRDIKQQDGEVWFVVSEDKAILKFARRHGVKTIKSEEFRRRLEKKLAPAESPLKLDPEKMDRSELEYWRDVFRKRGHSD